MTDAESLSPSSADSHSTTTAKEVNMIQILVIEDEKRVADLLKIGLEENGYQVLSPMTARWGGGCFSPTPSSWSSQT